MLQVILFLSFDDLKAVSMKRTISWTVTMCSLVEAVGSPETSANIYQATQRQTQKTIFLFLLLYGRQRAASEV
jgi:hypothetical protein